MFQRYLKDYSELELGVETPRPRHGLRAEGKVQGAFSEFTRRKLDIRVQRGQELAAIGQKTSRASNISIIY